MTATVATLDEFKVVDQGIGTKMLRVAYWATNLLGRGQRRLNRMNLSLEPGSNATERAMFFDRTPVEPKSLRAILGLCTGRLGTFLDIGANCGFYTLPAANAMAAGSQIIAYEPNPRMVRRLQRNIKRNDLRSQIKIRQDAVGSEPGTAQLFINDYDLGKSSLLWNEKHHNTTAVHDVNVVSLAALFAQNNLPRPIIMKMDIEGPEPDALEPVLETTLDVDLPNAILLETRHAAAWPFDLFPLLEARGYAATFTGEGNHLFERLKADGMNDSTLPSHAQT